MILEGVNDLHGARPLSSGVGRASRGVRLRSPRFGCARCDLYDPLA